MLLFQAVLISLLGYLGTLSTPWLFGLTGGWYTLTRPLVSGFLIGIITGNVTQGIIIGVAVQAVYIAMVTPGGQMPADLNFVAYPAIALALLSHVSTGVAVTLATTTGVVGTVIWNFFQLSNSYWNHRAARAIENEDRKGLYFNAVVGPQIWNFILRFIPSFLMIYFGSTFATKMLNSMPKYLIDVMSYLGGALPAIGVAILLTAIVKQNLTILFFIFGFVGVVFLKLNMIALAIFAGVIAFIYYLAISNNGGNNNTNSQATEGFSSDEDEEVF